MNWHLGTMGFSYDEWRHGVFYPAGMPARQYLGYYAQRFDAVEMDSTFYATPTADAVRRWREVTPSGCRDSRSATPASSNPSSAKVARMSAMP